MSATIIMLILLIISIFLFNSFFLYSGIKGGNLYAYIHKNNYKRWKELTSIGKSSAGFLNPFKGFSYIYNNFDVNDENILKYKISLRKGLKYTLLSLLATIIISSFLALFIMLEL